MLGTLKTMVSLEGIATLAKLEHLQEFLYESRGQTEEAFLENQQLLCNVHAGAAKSLGVLLQNHHPLTRRQI